MIFCYHKELRIEIKPVTNVSTTSLLLISEPFKSYVLLNPSNVFSLAMHQKNESCRNVYIQTIKLGIQSKLDEQNYSQMIISV